MGEKKVLLVEDERPITKAIATMLGANGLVVDVASTAEMALTQSALVRGRRRPRFRSA